MRQVKELHHPLFRENSRHAFSEKLARMATLLDGHPEAAEWVHEDLAAGKDPRGAKGMHAETVLRAALLMLLQELTYEELAFQCADSQAGRAFMRLGYGEVYGKSALQANIKAIREETWQRIQRLTVVNAAQSGFENGRTVRMDATVVETNISAPTDSTMIIDALRMAGRIVRWLNANDQNIKPAFSYRRAKKLHTAIINANGNDERKELYRTLVIGAGDVWKQLSQLRPLIEKVKASEAAKTRNSKALAHLELYLEPILAQTIARIFDEETLQAKEKILSFFEPHTDVIIKSRRDIEYGHKICLTTGRSNLVTDITIEDGNPSDSDLYLNLLERQRDLYGRYPRQTSCDGGFASQENVEEAKEKGVKDVCFTKRCALSIEEMCKSKAVFNRLKRFRPGIESNISCLKRAFGLKRVYWKGHAGFRAYIWAAVAAYNLYLLAQ